MKLHRIVSFAVAFTLILSVGFNISAEPDVPETGGTAEELALNENMVRAETESSRYELWLNIESADICLADTVTGIRWWSSPQTTESDNPLSPAAEEELRSQLVINYYDADKVTRNINSVKCIEQNSVEISYADNGFKAVYNFNEENFSITVLYQLIDDRLKITVPADGIKEPGGSKISTVTLLPNMFSGNSSESGYLLIPDGNGAIMRFSDMKPSAESYSGKVYGRDTAVSQLYQQGAEGQVLLPVFGMVREGSGLLCVIDGNEAAAAITATPSGKFSNRANAAAVFTLNQLDTAIIADRDWKYKEYSVAAEESTSYDCSISVYPLPEADGYSDLAAVYRELLDEEYDRSLSSESFAGTLELYGQGWKNTSFLGFPIKKNIEATDFEKASEIIGSISESVEGSLAVTLNGFGSESYERKTSNKVRPDGSLGGRGGLEELIENAPENAEIYWAQNIMMQYDTGIFKKKYAIRGLNHVPVKGGHYLLSTYAKEEDRFWWYLTPERVVYNLNRLVPSLKFECGLSLPFIGETLYSDYGDRNYTERQRSLEIIEEALSKTEKPLALSGGNLYAAVNVGLICGVEGRKALDGCMSEAVPFYSMVFYGYVNLSSQPLNSDTEWDEALLECLEYGLAPTIRLTAADNRELRETTLDFLVNTCFEDIRDAASELLSEYGKAAGQLVGSNMVYHERQGDVVTVRYSNGRVLTINRGETDFTSMSGVLRPGEWRID